MSGFLRGLRLSRKRRFTPQGDIPLGGEGGGAQNYSLLGDESFDRLNLDDTETDANGITLRGWYDKLLAGGTAGTYDSDFNSATNRPANRQGSMYITSLLTGLRMLGDLQLLDEAVRLTELWYGNLTTDGSGFLHHNDATHDQTLDVRLATGVFARVMYACHVNRGLTSPDAHDYGAIADKYKTYITDHYLPRWRAIEGTHLVEGIDHGNSTFRHSFGAALAYLHYVAAMGGGGGFTQGEWESETADALDLYFQEDHVCADGFNSRDTLVMPFTCQSPPTSSAADGLLYTTYIRYMVSYTIDLWMEGVDARFNTTWFTRLSNSFADFVIDATALTNNDLARCIGGDNPPGDARCTVEYNGTYRTRVGDADSRWQDSSYGLLEGFDSRGRITQFGVDSYASVSSTFADDYPNYPAARIFTNLQFGW